MELELRLSTSYVFSKHGYWKYRLIDHDKIELSNLNRQILYTSKDVGKYKVTQAKKVSGSNKQKN